MDSIKPIPKRMRNMIHQKVLTRYMGAVWHHQESINVLRGHQGYCVYGMGILLEPFIYQFDIIIFSHRHLFLNYQILRNDVLVGMEREFSGKSLIVSVLSLYSIDEEALHLPQFGIGVAPYKRWIV